MNAIHLVITTLLFLLTFPTCEPEQQKPNFSPEDKTKMTQTDGSQFNDYWYGGKAELNSYDLKQERYGEMRDGEVVLVFVTEPFSLTKHVKVDYPQKAGKDKVDVMKLNQVRKFITGIYDYSVLTSTFTAMDTKKHPYALKSTTSMQEWCGQTFTQFNLKGDKYQVKQFSYFESEGYEIEKITAALLEDELMTKIRINEGALTEGEIDLIPSTIYSRFSHTPIKPSKAQISKTETKKSTTYTVKYLNIKRTLKIEVENVFPFRILGWSEDNGDNFITTATLRKTLTEPYWNQHDVADESKRAELELGM